MRSSYNLVVAKSTTTSKSARPPPSPSSSSSYHRAMSIIPPKLKPWPHSMVESHGDYRSEAYLEDHIGGKLYSMQRSLPRLPVPNISDTITRLVPTVLPLARSDEERATFIKACEDFEGQAGELQRRLMERKEGEMRDSSWLQLWWNTLGYLQVRILFFLALHPSLEERDHSPRGHFGTIESYGSIHCFTRSVIPWWLTYPISSTSQMTAPYLKSHRKSLLGYCAPPPFFILPLNFVNWWPPEICPTRLLAGSQIQRRCVPWPISICSMPAASLVKARIRTGFTIRR
jgi:hypothetical protein